MTLELLFIVVTYGRSLSITIVPREFFMGMAFYDYLIHIFSSKYRFGTDSGRKVEQEYVRNNYLRLT